MAKKLCKIEIVKRVLESRQNRKVTWISKEGKNLSAKLDYFSAQAINVVYEAMSEDNREKMMNATWPQIINFCFKHTTLKVV